MPISLRANVILRNLVEAHGARDGRWGANMSSGCAEIWAVQFGYRAGLRRGREDVVALAEATASRVASDLRALALVRNDSRADQGREILASHFELRTKL